MRFFFVALISLSCVTLQASQVVPSPSQTDKERTAALLTVVNFQATIQSKQTLIQSLLEHAKIRLESEIVILKEQGNAFAQELKEVRQRLKKEYEEHAITKKELEQEKAKRMLLQKNS